ncbi:MAG: PH domain-containing protein [Pyrinomonadaceae bacterium]
MFCSKCGKENSDDAVYCQKCGRPFDAEEETRVAMRLSTPKDVRRQDPNDSPQIFSITPTVKFVYAGYIVALVTAFVAAVVVGSLMGLTPSGTMVVGILFVIVAMLIPAYFHLKKRLVRYTLTDTMIEIDRGLISRTTQNIPLRRIQDVTVSATVTQRMFGFGDVIIDNASEDGGKVVLNDIDAPKKYAELMLREMRQLER